MSSTSIQIVNYPIEKIGIAPNDPIQVSDELAKKTAHVLGGLDFFPPSILNKYDHLMFGHIVYRAAKMLGLKELPCARIEDMSDEQEIAFRIAYDVLNKEKSLDEKTLKQNLISLVEVEFDMSLTGLSEPVIDNIISIGDEPEKVETDPLAVLDEADQLISKLNDVFILDDHRLICGDSRFKETYERLMGDEKADIIFCDSPYNVKIEGNVSGLGKNKHKDFEMGCGEMNRKEFISFLKTVFDQLVKFSKDGSIHYHCMDAGHVLEISLAIDEVYAELKTICTWVKTNAGMGSFYRNQTEFVFVCKNGKAKHTNNIQLGKHGRNRSNYWLIPGVNSFGKNRDKELSMHPTVKPVKLVADVMLDASNRGEVVLDPFGGSGTTLIAAHRTGRIARLIEISPMYVDVIVKRWQEETGKQAINEETGLTFDELAKVRLNEEAAS